MQSAVKVFVVGVTAVTAVMIGAPAEAKRCKAGRGLVNEILTCPPKQYITPNNVKKGAMLFTYPVVGAVVIGVDEYRRAEKRGQELERLRRRNERQSAQIKDWQNRFEAKVTEMEGQEFILRHSDNASKMGDIILELTDARICIQKTGDPAKMSECVSSALDKIQKIAEG